MTEVILEQRQNVTVSIENVPILPGDGKENILQFPVSFVLKLLPRRLLNEWTHKWKKKESQGWAKLIAERTLTSGLS